MVITDPVPLASAASRPDDRGPLRVLRGYFRNERGRRLLSTSVSSSLSTITFPALQKKHKENHLVPEKKPTNRIFLTSLQLP